MSNRFIYCSDGKMKALHEDLLVDINLRTCVNKFMYVGRVTKCGILFTSDTKQYLNRMSNYFSEDSIIDFTGPLILVKFNTEYLSKYHKNSIYWIAEKNGVQKGENPEAYYYEWGDYLVMIDKSLCVVEVYNRKDADFDKFLPYFIKILEGVIISLHIRMGFFPVHGGLLKKEKGNYLILGDSQAGKTTVMGLLQSQGYEYLSDDIVFFDLNGRAYPFGNYKKVMEQEEKSGCFYEKCDGIVRRVEKIPGMTSKEGLFIDKILLPGIKFMPECRLTLCTKSSRILTGLLAEYPCGYFVWEKYLFSRSISVINELSKKETYNLELAYGKPNEEAIRVWEGGELLTC